MPALSDILVVYAPDTDGVIHEQPLSDIASVGTLIDPDTGDDLVPTAWRFAEDPTVSLQAVIEFAERGIARELGAIDARNHYTDQELADMRDRFENGNAGIQLLHQLVDSGQGE